MFDVLDELNYSDTLEIAYYTIDKIQNHHDYEPEISSSNKELANRLIDEIKMSRENLLKHYIGVLYDKIMVKAESEDLIDKDKGAAMLYRIKKKYKLDRRCFGARMVTEKGEVYKGAVHRKKSLVFHKKSIGVSVPVRSFVVKHDKNRMS